jgi:hypothetical protein
MNQKPERRDALRDGMLKQHARLNDFLKEHAPGGQYLFEQFGWAEAVFTPLFMRFWFLEYYEDFDLPNDDRYARVRAWRDACVAHPAAQQVTKEQIVKLYYDYAKDAGNGALLPGRRQSSYTFETDWRASVAAQGQVPARRDGRRTRLVIRRPERVPPGRCAGCLRHRPRFGARLAFRGMARAAWSGRSRHAPVSRSRSLQSRDRIAPHRRCARPIIAAKQMPASDAVPVTIHVHCQPPDTPATHATTGGPTNWPRAENCSIQPTVVDTIRGPGANRTASANSAPGTRPPTAESISTAE